MSASTMDGPVPPPPPSSPLRRPRARAAGALAVAVATLSAPFAVAAAQEPAAAPARPDQVFRTNPRTGVVVTLAGTVTENSLENVRMERDGSENSYDAGEIVRIVWGAVPPSYRDGTTYSERGDFENAVASFRVAAGDASAREVVRASARLQAAEALLAWGTLDPNRFAEAATEAERFLSDFPSNRRVPHALWTKARATLLAGDTAAAAAQFRALYEEGANDPPTPGYQRADCLEAGLAAAGAFLRSGETAPARELYIALEVAFGEAANSVQDATSPLRARLLAGAGEASVGEGYCLLAGGQADRALKFFEERARDTDAPSAARFSASLGLAEAYLATGDLRRAQIEFARVSALDHTDRDRVARAMVGLADTSIRLADADAVANARRWLTKVAEDYGDTPAASRAAELLTNL